MGQDGPVTPPVSEPAIAPADGPADAAVMPAALVAHGRRVRRARAIYAAVVGTVVAAVLVGVVVAWNRGEISHATLHTVAAPPASIPLAQPGSELKAAWHTGDQLAIGTAQYGGTVVTWSAHAVGGRDARTGERTWSYTRTD